MARPDAPAFHDVPALRDRGTEPSPRHLVPLLRGCRPRQMMKNLLVLTAPALAGDLFADGRVLAGAVVAFLTFCAVSGAVYLGNDLRDVEADRCHPVKRFRAIASGDLSPRVAGWAAAALVTGALATAAWWSVPLALVLAAYLAIQVAYSTGLKHRAGVDLLAVASGFVLRVVAGGVAAGVELSAPFLVVVGFGSLFMVAGKRYSEMVVLGSAAGTRRSLAGYSLTWLRVAWTLSALVAVAAYALAAVGMAPLGSDSSAWAMASVPAFGAGMLRYAVHVDRGEAGCPEAVVLADRPLELLGLLWVVLVAVAVAVA